VLAEAGYSPQQIREMVQAGVTQVAACSESTGVEA